MSPTPNVRAPSTQSAEYRYHLLRAALATGAASLAGLEQNRLVEITQRADQSYELESLVLSSEEARDIVLPPERLEQAFTELRRRYQDEEELLADLERNGLDLSTLQTALHRELVFDATLQRVAARRRTVSDVDERLFFELHRDRFTQPERRSVRHILITVNEAYPENRREAAFSRAEELATKLKGGSSRFARLARAHSECPTAMEDGRLGVVPRGELFPALDEALFSMDEGASSGPVESELGFHLLWCEKIHPAQTLPFRKVRDRIRELLDERTARNCQKAWIQSLRQHRSPGDR